MPSLGIATLLLGHRCYICGQRERARETMEIHHIDGNNNNNAKWNLAFAHKICHRNLTKLNKQYNSAMNATPSLTVPSDGCTNRCEREREIKSGGGSNFFEFFPVQTEERERSILIKDGLQKFLFEAAKSGMSRKDIVHSAPSYIDINDPPSELTVRRWLNVFTSGAYPYRFDPKDRLYIEGDEVQVQKANVEEMK